MGCSNTHRRVLDASGFARMGAFLEQPMNKNASSTAFSTPASSVPPTPTTVGGPSASASEAAAEWERGREIRQRAEKGLSSIIANGINIQVS